MIRINSKINSKTGLAIVIVSAVAALLIFQAQGVFNQFFSELKSYYLPENQQLQIQTEQAETQPYTPQTTQEAAVIDVVKKTSPSVVSIIISKDLPVFRQRFYDPFEEFFGPGSPFRFEIPKYEQEGTERRTIGGGTGFVISRDGLVLTNKHVVLDTEAEYTMITNSSQSFQAEVLARDPFQDLAILKISPDSLAEQNIQLQPVVLGDSLNLQIGQSVVAIGNALGEFRNTISVGVISGLGRTITASGEGIIETLEDVIQTDAAINRGNSGGPLLNLKGEVIGVNVAMAEAAQSIGFAIPINKAKKAIEQVKQFGKIVYPFLGVRYILINKEIQQERNLNVDYGALLVKGSGAGESAVLPESAADKAGLEEGDIILKFGREKITPQNSLAKIIQNHNVGDRVILEVLRGSETLEIEAVLGEKSSG